MFSNDVVEKYLELTEEWMPPWCMYLPDKKRKQTIAQRRWGKLQENMHTQQDRYELYFSHYEDSMARRNLSCPEIMEYLDYKFFAENFGLKPWEVENCKAEWVLKMMAVATAENKVKIERMG